MKYIFACDESGAKGYADQKESYLGEVGVVAGFIIEDSIRLEITKLISDSIKNLNELPIDKLHISNLSKDNQRKLRENIFNLFNKYNVPISYGAAYVDGFNWKYENDKQKNTSIVESAIRNGRGISMNYPIPLLQTELFNVFVLKGLDLFVANKMIVNHIEIVTDQIDNLVKANYEKKISNITGNSKSQTKKWIEFDYSNREITKRQFKIELNSNLPEGDFINKLEWSITVINNELSIAADIISNSILYCLEKYAKESVYSALNNCKAIEKHPLSAQMIGMSNNPNHTSMFDRIHMHRKCNTISNRIG